MRLSTALTGLLLFALLLSPAEAEEPAGSEADPVRIVASIYPIAMLVEEIGGDRVHVTTVVPPGADPHHFELTPSSAKAIHDSRAVFMIGGEFDSWIMGGQPRHAGVRAVFYQPLSDSLIEMGGTFNPHFWLDPLIARKMGEYIGLTLVTVDSANRSYYERRVGRFGASMDSLHARTAARLRASDIESFVSFHPAWTYFARRYGLVEAGVVEKTPEQEPSARWVAGLIREIERQNVRIMIVEEASDPGVVQGIANDTGVEVIVLDPVGNPDMEGRRDYFELMDHNVRVLERAGKGN
jgi:ABC-type Zn uptake system ZnuABC Zn-binding protein ZnuA